MKVRGGGGSSFACKQANLLHPWVDYNSIIRRPSPPPCWRVGGGEGREEGGVWSRYGPHPWQWWSLAG